MEEKGDGCGENAEDTDNDGDEEEEDSDEDDEEEKEDGDEEEEEDEERDTSTEGRPSSQDDCSERPSEKTSSHVSLTLFKKKYVVNSCRRVVLTSDLLISPKGRRAGERGRWRAAGCQRLVWSNWIELLPLDN